MNYFSEIFKKAIDKRSLLCDNKATKNITLQNESNKTKLWKGAIKMQAFVLMVMGVGVFVGLSAVIGIFV